MHPERLGDFKVLTFDCYGTLIDWETGILNELKPWAARHGLTLDDDTLLEALRRGGGGVREDHAREALSSDPRGGARAARETVVRSARRGGGPGVRRVRGRVAGVRRQSEGSRVPPEALQPGHPLQRRPPFLCAERVAAGDHFKRVITAEHVGSYKPDVRNFEYMLKDLERTLGAGPEVILHTAQSLFHDIVPAKAMGLTTMWINRRKASDRWGATPPPPVEGTGAAPDLEVAGMAEFVSLHQAVVG